MSGIPNSVGASQFTESVFYHLAVGAARTFQILQVGLTCLSYDCKYKGLLPDGTAAPRSRWLTSPQAGYRARTFTFQLTPEFFPPNTALAKLIDRKLVLSYRSFLFLKENNFSFEKTFSQGVPYLSRSEEIFASSLYLTKPQNWSDAGKDTQPQELWDSEYKRRHDSVVRQTGKHTPTPPTPRSHELTPPNHLGFRYIIEALVGGSFASALNPELLLSNHLPPALQSAAASQLGQDLHLYEARLRTRRPTLIGHNPFLDLCFLHETFLQTLPADALGFRRATRRFFPRIIDTKHLACQLDWEPSCNLAQLYDDLVVGWDRRHHHPHNPHEHHHHPNPHPQHHQPPPPPPPPIIPEPGFDARERGGAAHSAGFDSWMAAAVFVALSAQVLARKGGGPLLPPVPPPSLRGLRREGGMGVTAAGSRPGKGDELFRELCPFAARGLKGGAKMGPGKGSGELPPPPPPRWDGEVWRRYGNRLRMGAAGVMDLARG
ncbi:ribonuclease H-like domain-containing protein [Chaetomium fimeti]|uniref:Ribonuclease H-like domain-containing protein n=1 Tax=Chaetomium fimeti TaxID=1854472 RepID=A0AAE0HFM3_9PEZI|nr:ribonuclease H-like domain-containing protein [Chaetomium fimeti]